MTTTAPTTVPSGEFDWNVAAATKTLVIGFSGHTQNESESAPSTSSPDSEGFWHPNPEVGVWKIRDKLASSGIPEVKRGNILMLAEDPGNDSPLTAFLTDEFCGDGVAGQEKNDGVNINVDIGTGQITKGPEDVLGAFHAVLKAIALGVKKIALFGYSHGGSTMRLLTQMLYGSDDLAGNGNGGFLASHGVQIVFTAYIDAVRIQRVNEAFPGNDPDDPNNPFGIQPDSYKQLASPPGRPLVAVEWDEPEYRFPYMTPYHVNIYQRKSATSGNVSAENVYTGFNDLRGSMLNPALFNPYGRTIDHAPMPAKFGQFNLEDGATEYVGNYEPTAGINDGLPLHAVPGLDHSDGGESGKGIDDEPLTADYVAFHMGKAFADART